MTEEGRGEKKKELCLVHSGKEKLRNKKGSGFLSGVFVLSLSAVIVKIIGLVYKIPMLRLLGSEGMGYFNSAYELYALFCVISTAGLPVAMSVMISSSLSRKESGAERIFRISMGVFLILGVVGTVILLIFAGPFADFLGGERATRCILAIAPTVFFICLGSAYRGYFQGYGQMAPTAISQIIEALGKLILGLLFAAVALGAGYPTETVAAFAVLGLTLGTAVSALYLAISKKITASKEPHVPGKIEKNGKILSTLLKTAVPVTLSSAVISLTKVIDMTMILRRMQNLGYSSQEAFSAYGSYTTLALPLFSLAPALITSVAMSLIPTLSRAVAEKDKVAQAGAVADAIRLTALVSMPISLGLTLFSEPILELIFSGEQEAIATAAPLLAVLGLSVTLSCLVTVSNAILQAYSKATVPMLSMVIGSLLKLVLAYILVGNPSVGIMGAPISTFFCDLAINTVNFAFICKVMPDTPRISEGLLRPFLAALISVAVSRVAYNLASAFFGASAFVTVACIALAALMYLIFAVAFGAVGRKELSAIPILRRASAVLPERKNRIFK